MIKKKLRFLLSASILSIFITVLLSGCGGSGSGGNVPGMGTFSGTAVKGPVSGATVNAFAVTNGTMGMQLAQGTTDSQGNFTMTLGDYTGPVMLQMTGGTYTDEATGATMTVAAGDVMTAVIPSVSSGVSVTGLQVTPLTSMAQVMAQNMTGSMTQANIAAANTAVGGYFMVDDILHTQPMNPLVSGSGATATQYMRNYGMTLAAMSQEAQALGLTSSSGIVTAMMDDASDGVMNGMMGGSQISMGGMGGGMMGGGTMMQSTAGTAGLADAMITFMTSTANQSGLTVTDMQTLMNQLTSSNGTIQ